jgi:hypothetical protein
VTDSESEDLVWLRDHGYDEETVRDARRWFADHGWDVRIVERDQREEMSARGEVYFPGFKHRFWVDLVRMGETKPTATNYASGATESEAVIRARQRFGSEQT